MTSLTGMCSGTTTMSFMPASTVSRNASRTNAAGTKNTDAFAPVCLTASSTLSKTGSPSTIAPPFPGVTPPTTFVPYSSIQCVWTAPTRPVIPWTITRVESSINKLISSLDTLLFMVILRNGEQRCLSSVQKSEKPVDRPLRRRVRHHMDPGRAEDLPRLLLMVPQSLGHYRGSSARAP